MSTSPAPSPPTTAVFEVGAPEPTGDANPPAPDGCPLCGAPLNPEQEWCLSCGAAARTRLAMSSNWKRPIIVVAVVAVLSIAVIAISLVELAGGSNTTTTSVTITSTAAATTPAPTTTPTTPPAATAPATTAPAAAPPTTKSAATPAPAATSKTTTTSTSTTGTSHKAGLEQATLHKIEKLERKDTSPAEKKQLLELEKHLKAGK